MSIASEIQDLNTNLTSAKNAVTVKGGTVGDTGLAGLASEIMTIPSGGVTPENYGIVTYKDNGVEKTVTMVDEEDFYMLSLPSSSAVLTINNITMVKSDILEVKITDGVTFLPDNFLYGATSLRKVDLPSSLVWVGSNVFAASTKITMGTINLTNVEDIGSAFCSGSLTNAPIILDNVKSIGDSFLSGCTDFNQPLSLPKIRTIGSLFLNGDSSFNSLLTLNSDLEVIGNRFMYGCSGFAQTFSIPSGLVYGPGERFMHNCNNFIGPLICNSASASIPSDNYALGTTTSTAVMYTTGVTLTGPYAAQWKAALPDRTTSPYRKLIIGS